MMDPKKTIKANEDNDRKYRNGWDDEDKEKDLEESTNQNPNDGEMQYFTE